MSRSIKLPSGDGWLLGWRHRLCDKRLPVELWGVPCVGPVVKETVGERAAEALIEKEEQQRHLRALVGEAIGVVVPVALQEIMGLHLA